MLSETVLIVLPFFGANLVFILLAVRVLRSRSFPPPPEPPRLDSYDTGYRDGFDDGLKEGARRTVTLMLSEQDDSWSVTPS